jgi:Protein of unknown function (DUF3017)
MKHSAKAAARLERERSKQERRNARRQRAARAPAQPAVSQPAVSQPAAVVPATGDSDPGRGGHQKAAQLPYAVVLAGVVAGLVLMQVAKDAVRGGTFVIAGALLAASLTRLVLPEGRTGLLGSRRRLVDVALLTVLGAGLLTAGFIAHVPG